MEKKAKRKKQKNKSNFIVLIPLILVMVVDIAFTIIGQSKDYWQNYSNFNEANPMGQILLSAGPIYTVIFSALYILLIIFLIKKLPKPLNIMIYIGFFVGHIWGGVSWLPEILEKFFSIEISEFNSGIIYFIIIAIISGFCFSKRIEKLN
jgi:hypothetical protein